MGKKKEQNSGGNSGPTLVPQPHGGALLAGGRPGHRGGPGRPPSAFRELARRMLEDRGLLSRLADIAEGKVGEIVKTEDGRQFCETPIREQRGAIAELLRVGVPNTGEITKEEIRARLADTIRVIEDRFAEVKSAEELLDAIAPIWI